MVGSLLAVCCIASQGGPLDACVAPQSDLEIPDGRRASRAAMEAARQRFDAYVAAAEAHLACLDEAYLRRPAAEDEYRRLRESMLAAMRALAQRYNAAVEAYNTRRIH